MSVGSYWWTSCCCSPFRHIFIGCNKS